MLTFYDMNILSNKLVIINPAKTLKTESEKNGVSEIEL